MATTACKEKEKESEKANDIRKVNNIAKSANNAVKRASDDVKRASNDVGKKKQATE